MYAALSLVTVFLHVSVSLPLMTDPYNYTLAECSGVFIAPDTVLTAAHCIEDSRGKQWIKTVDEKSYAVDVVKKDVKNDLALLKTQNHISHAYTDIGKPANVSDKVYTVGASHGYRGTYSEGIVNNNVIEYHTDILSVLHSANIASGASGSGLFNKKKELIGINIATVRGFTQAVHIDVINNFLANEPL